MKKINLCLLISLLMIAAPATGQTLTEVDALSFGTFGLGANDVQAAITVTPDNDVFADPQIIPGAGAQRGEYRLEDFPPNVSFYLGTDVPNPPSEGGLVLGNVTTADNGAGPVFYLSDLTISNGGILQTDGQGDATLYIGGTLRTSGTGDRYDGGTYTGSYTLTIYY